MPLLSTSSKEEAKANTVDYVFEDTLCIPSYLFAFAIGQFYTEEEVFRSTLPSSTIGELPIRTFIPSNPSYYSSVADCKFISKILMGATLASLQALEVYFEIPFWLPKLDLVAVPHMLLAGMEHLACCFLHVIPSNNKDSYSSVENDVLHEIAHHWVGNLTGMSLKLKEGIVQYIEKIFAEKLFNKKGGITAVASARKKGSSSSGVSLSSNTTKTSPLLKEFYKLLNEEFYQKSLKLIENGVETCGGEKVFQQRLADLIREYPQLYIDDETAESKLFH
jgi:aminopeptidase N